MGDLLSVRALPAMYPQYYNISVYHQYSVVHQCTFLPLTTHSSSPTSTFLSPMAHELVPMEARSPATLTYTMY